MNNRVKKLLFDWAFANQKAVLVFQNNFPQILMKNNSVVLPKLNFATL